MMPSSKCICAVMVEEVQFTESVSRCHASVYMFLFAHQGAAERHFEDLGAQKAVPVRACTHVSGLLSRQHWIVLD